MTHRRPVVVLLMILAVLAAASPAASMEGKLYGRPLTGEETTPISELLTQPDRFVGETVRVTGVVTGVCEKRGCWMSIASDREFEDLRIKAEDGVIVFPMSAKGRRAVAEGVFTRIEMSLDQTIRYKQHHAEEHGETFDASSVTEPMTFYQIDVTGAVVR